MKKQYLIYFSLILTVVVSAVAIAKGMPSTIELDQLENVYRAVSFDHGMHVDAADDCKTCHHKPFGKTKACASCHDKPVEKKAFDHADHQKTDTCISCHQVKSTKSLACISCHKVPFDEKNLTVPGLKAALHKTCMDCHKKNEMDNSCDFCHQVK